MILHLSPNVFFGFSHMQALRCNYNTLQSAFLLLQDVIVLALPGSGTAGRSNRVISGGLPKGTKSPKELNCYKGDKICS